MYNSAILPLELTEYIGEVQLGGLLTRPLLINPLLLTWNARIQNFALFPH